MQKKKADLVRKRGFINPKRRFTDLELRLLKLINYPLKEVFNALDKGKILMQEQEDKTNESSNPTVNNYDDNNTNVNNREYMEFVYLGDQDKQDSTHNYDVLAPADKETLEDYKINDNIDLERERRHQKTEELKLKALELKLKADELNLKESEISKVNYLTKLEEEKLKFMTNIAASLKELVEWTKNGGTRFHNVMKE